MIEVTLRADGEYQQGIELTCDGGHTSRFGVTGMTYHMVLDYCAMLDGSSAMYVRDPRTDPTNTWIGKCRTCGQPFTATPFGYEDLN
jgi:hypothetical protein